VTSLIVFVYILMGKLVNWYCEVHVNVTVALSSIILLFHLFVILL